VAASVVTPPPVSTVLDIGTGSGVWGSAFAVTFPQAQVTYFDQESVLPQVRGNLERLKLLERARLQPGNLFTQDFGEGLYDVIILPQVLNVLLPRDLPGLIQRAARALKPTGTLVIAEYVLSDGRDGPLDHLYFHFRRFITNEGDLLSFPEYQAILREAGLPQARCFPLLTQEIILAGRSEDALPRALAAPPANPKSR
jgi:SAM-dependent methyltransferase